MYENSIRLIDLFSGAGGFTLGFVQHFGDRIKPVWANDFNQAAADSYNANFGKHCSVGDIVDILEDKNTVIPQQVRDDSIKKASNYLCYWHKYFKKLRLSSFVFFLLSPEP